MIFEAMMQVIVKHDAVAENRNYTTQN
jgi:hypothetical protein